MRAGIRFYHLSSYGLDKILKDLTEVNIFKSRHDTKRVLVRADLLEAYFEIKLFQLRHLL